MLIEIMTPKEAESRFANYQETIKQVLEFLGGKEPGKQYGVEDILAVVCAAQKQDLTFFRPTVRGVAEMFMEKEAVVVQEFVTHAFTGVPGDTSVRSVQAAILCRSKE